MASFLVVFGSFDLVSTVEEEAASARWNILVF